MALEQKAIGRRIASLREQKGWSQEDAAHKIGVTVRTYQRWEAGATSLRMRHLSELADTFEVDPVVIIGEPMTDRLAALEAGQQQILDELAAIREFASERVATEVDEAQAEAQRRASERRGGSGRRARGA